jgi:hypothetical protein
VRRYHLLPRLRWRVLLLVDDSAASNHAALLCEAVVAASGARLTVMGDAKQESSAVVSRLRSSLPASDMRLSFGEGSSTQKCLAELDRIAYDLVFLPGRSESGGDASRKDGIDSRRIATSSPVSVLLAQGEPRPTERVLLCTAAGEAGKLDVLLGAQLARAFGARVTLLFVERADLRAGEPTGDSTAARRTRTWIERHLDQGVRTLEGQGAAAEKKVRYGDPLTEILAEASEGSHDLVIVGGHVERTYLDAPERDLASDLVHRADRPILVVKGKVDR